MGNQLGPSGLDTEDYNKEVGEIRDYAFGTHTQSRSHVNGKLLAI